MLRGGCCGESMVLEGQCLQEGGGLFKKKAPNKEQSSHKHRDTSRQGKYGELFLNSHNVIFADLHGHHI